MKKILLFSLIILISVGGGDIAMADSCRQITNGAVICGSIPVGGSMESGKCKKDDGTFKDIGARCNPVNAPTDFGHCIKSNVAGQTSCAAEKCNGGYLLYTTNRRHEIDVVGTNGKVGSQGICTSRQALENFCETKCNCDALGDGYKCGLNEVLVNNFASDNDVPNVPAYIGEEVCICKEMSCEERYPNNAEAQACCVSGKGWDSTNNTCKCGENEEWKKVDGSWKCEKKVKNNEPVDDEVDEDGSQCKYMLTVDITCPDGKTFYKNEPLTEEQYKALSCKDFNNLMKTATNNKITTIDLVKNIQAEVAAYKELLQTICKDHLKKAVDVDAAKKTLKSFFANAKENASVWKTESGNFNGTRLASDLTAGVVLGTVGGVVSANVIKKNQIKKGYEVLHCTIGGQTVADWGDTFNTGLRR